MDLGDILCGQIEDPRSKIGKKSQAETMTIEEYSFVQVDGGKHFRQDLHAGDYIWPF